MKILVTGFEPFGKEKINPALEAVKKLDNKINGAKIVKTKIPTIFKKAIEKLEKEIEKEKPDIVICVGQAGGRSKITVERVAINIDDATIKDNEGNKPLDNKIFKDGKNAYFSRLPIKTIVKEMTKNKIPASISNTAGTFVCNHLMYGLLYLIDKKYPNIWGGFIHVPFIPEQTLHKEAPSMSLDEIIKGLTVAISVTVKNKKNQNNLYSSR